MNGKHETPFESIESAQEFVDLLAEAVDEAIHEVEQDSLSLDGPGIQRRREALQLVAYKLSRLSDHMNKSRRLLNDLRTLRRLLQEERVFVPVASTKD